MTYAVEIRLDALIFIPSPIRIGSGMNFIRRDSQTHGENSARKSLLEECSVELSHSIMATLY
jgi:Tfp pilus assembly protein PilF